MYEIVNKKDKSRLSHPVGMDSTTLFKSAEEAVNWASDRRVPMDDYEILPARMA